MSHISGDSNSQKTWEFLKFVCFFEVFWKFESFSLRIGRFLGLQKSPRPIWPQRSGSDLFRICGCVFWCFVGKKIGCGKSPTGAIGILPKKEVLISKHQPCLNDWWMICLTHTHTIFHSKVSNDTPAGSQVRQGCGNLPCMRKDANRNNFRKNRRGKGIKLGETGSPTKTLNN